MKQKNRPVRRVLSGGVLALLLMGVLGTTSDAAAQPAVLTAMRPAQTKTDTLVPLGRTVGIKLFSDGVLVVGLAEGGDVPARQMGLKVGDLITHVNGTEVDTIEQVQTLLAALAEGPLTMRVTRGEKSLELSGSVTRSEDGTYRLGVWIRDSMAGIGTMTFYDPKSDTFAALGHGINDVDTSKLMTLESGSIMYSTVTGVKRGQSGAPGQLNGSFDVRRDMGQLRANTRAGVYGTLTDESLLGGAQPMEVAHRGQIKTGKATILSNIDGEEVEEYEVEILHVYPTVEGELRNLMLKVTDPRLLEKTGGIVQGMSGSPILQNGRIVGAVTHVLVNDPTRGYGIFIDNMLAAAG
ncbi:MAG: SpoIVB peptidase [Oscillospiraceae bacterium]|nr:SpoIVB peptidase [Oscillospiraceae bacterium]